MTAYSISVKTLYGSTPGIALAFNTKPESMLYAYSVARSNDDGSMLLAIGRVLGTGDDGPVLGPPEILSNPEGGSLYLYEGSDHVYYDEMDPQVREFFFDTEEKLPPSDGDIQIDLSDIVDLTPLSPSLPPLSLGGDRDGPDVS